MFLNVEQPSIICNSESVCRVLIHANLVKEARKFVNRVHMLNSHRIPMRRKLICSGASVLRNVLNKHILILSPSNARRVFILASPVSPPKFVYLVPMVS